MPDDDALIERWSVFFAELARVCPEAATGLAIAGEPPPMLSLEHRIAILKALPDNAGVDAFMAAWFLFAAANPAAVVAHDSAQAIDMVSATGDGTVIGPPPAPITVDDLYRAFVLLGEPVRRARQIATDFEPDVDRPGAIWMGDILLYVALLSPEHEQRIREYLKVDPSYMSEQLDRLRADVAARDARPKTAVVENYYDDVAGTWVTPETRYEAIVGAPKFAPLSGLISTEPARAWPLLLELIDAMPEDVLYLIGEGPLDEFLAMHGTGFVDQIEAQARTSSRFRECLSETSLGRGRLTADVEHRIVSAMRRKS